jgi:arsenite methyltransferase
MAELTAPDPDPAAAPTSACCAPEQQVDCCEPSDKAGCCSPEASSCGCSAGREPAVEDVREQVRARYAAVAQAATGASCCGNPVSLTDESGAEVFGASLYDATTGGAPPDAVAASLGCGVPTAVADLHEGETVLDLGSGAGADVLISAAASARAAERSGST